MELGLQTGTQTWHLTLSPAVERSTPMHIENGHIVESDVEARGAFLDPQVLVVLASSLALVFGLYLLLFVGHFG
jgi:hypothetical protein